MQEYIDTQTKILDAAQYLAQTRGYNGFSYADIAEHVGIRKASIHYHFPSKKDLGRELVIRYRMDFLVSLARIEQEVSDPRQKLERYVGVFRTTLHDEGRMCLCGMLASDLMTLPPEVREEVQKFFMENKIWLARVLEEGRNMEVLHWIGSAEAEAQAFLSILEGAMLVGRLQADTAWFEVATRQALARLESS